MKRENLKRGMMVLTKFYEFFLRVVRVFGWVHDFFFPSCVRMGWRFFFSSCVRIFFSPWVRMGWRIFVFLNGLMDRIFYDLIFFFHVFGWANLIDKMFCDFFLRVFGWLNEHRSPLNFSCLDDQTNTEFYQDLHVFGWAKRWDRLKVRERFRRRSRGGETSHLAKECNCCLRDDFSVWEIFIRRDFCVGKGHWHLISDNCRAEFDNKRYKRGCNMVKRNRFLICLFITVSPIYFLLDLYSAFSFARTRGK